MLSLVMLEAKLVRTCPAAGAKKAKAMIAARAGDASQLAGRTAPLPVFLIAVV
jgi:hypothetical protein